VLSDVGQTVEVLYVARTGSGYKLHKVGIFAFQRDTIKLLWDHTAQEVSLLLPTENGTEDEYQWKLSKDGRKIRVDGIRKTRPKPRAPGEDWGPATAQKLPSKTFCWDSVRVSYAECSGSH